MITFATVLYGNNHIEYLYVLFQSILQIYERETCIVLYYAEVDEKYIDAIKKKIPSVILRKFENCDFLKKDLQTRISLKTIMWCKILEEQTWLENVVFLDVDTLLVQKIDSYFSSCPNDIFYTFKTHEDENLNWPLNTGVILVKNSPVTLNFFRCWRDGTIALTSSSEKEKQKARNLWGGEDQAIFGRLLRTRDRKKFSELIVADGALLQGVPCEELNETRCVPIVGSTHIIHYKGRWRSVLAGEGFSEWRSKEKCLIMYDLWMEKLREWKNLV